jgi:hypothetical protein
MEPIITKAEIEEQEKRIQRKLEAGELWSILLADYITTAIAPRGYKEHKIYGQVVLAECVTRESINELSKAVLQEFAEHRLNMLRAVTTRNQQILKELAANVAAFQAESAKSWFTRSSKKLGALESQHAALQAQRTLIAELYTTLESIKPSKFK